MTITASSVPRRDDEGVATALFEGEAVLYHLGDNRVHLLNGTAALVWSICDGSGSVGELIDDLAAVFDASRDAISSGVLDLLGDLVADGLVTLDG